MSSLTMNQPISIFIARHHWLRGIAILPLAALLTAALFYAMHLMIFNDVVAPFEEPPKKITSIFIDQTPLVTHTKPLLERPSDPIDIPEAPVVDPVLSELPSLKTGPIFQKPDFSKSRANVVLGDNQLTPFIRVSPNYPRQALERGVEGFVDVRFDVTSFGGTDNISVIGAEPEGMFEKSALKAVRKWKYKPELLDGQPQPAFNQRERIRFRLQK